MIDSIRIKSRFWILPYFNYRFHYTCHSKSFQYDLFVFITFQLAIISGKAISDKYKPSPLFQGGLEIPIKVFLNWADGKSMTILKEKVKSVNYPCDMDYVDNSKKILKDLLGESMAEDEEEAEVCKTPECDRGQRASSKGIISKTHFSVKCFFILEKNIGKVYT